MITNILHPQIEVEKHSQLHPTADNGRYQSPAPTSPSLSSSSIFSADALSQSSHSSGGSATSAAHHLWDSSEGQEKVCPMSQRSQTFPLPQTSSPGQGRLPDIQPVQTVRRTATVAASTAAAIQATEQRQHPRRCSANVRRAHPPSLVRQSERKGNFVDKLVDSATLIVEIIWPLSVPSCRSDSNAGRGVLPLRTFIQETLRRSRTSYSTLQVALYYLILIKSHVPGHDFTMEQPHDVQSLRALQCGRRMFLAALILASKYLQDRNYSARAWSKISGLRVCEINSNELTFCQAVNWNLHITENTFDRWSDIVLKHTPSSQPPPSPSVGGSVCSKPGDWRTTIPLLTPGLGAVTGHSPVSDSARSDISIETADRQKVDVAEACPSYNTTPTPSNPPRYLEPKLDMAPPPPPSLARLGLLPTPQLTPKSLVGANTPVGRQALSIPLGKPAMCSAMAKVQAAGLHRQSIEGWVQLSRPTSLDGYQYPSGKHSLAPPSVASSVASSVSSPESMVSDQPSRSSRASSISSVSSSNWGCQPSLARVATCRNAMMPLSTPSDGELGKAGNGTSITNSNTCAEEAVSALEHLAFSEGPSAMNTPLPAIHLESPVPATAVKVLSCSSDDGPRRSSARSRKRGRSSADTSNLHKDVRAILYASSPSLRSGGERTDLQKPDLEEQCKTPTGLQELQRPVLARQHSTEQRLSVPRPVLVRQHSTEQRLSVPRDLGRKRACCADEVLNEYQVAGGAIHASSRWQGPGMWNGVL